MAFSGSEIAFLEQRPGQRVAHVLIVQQPRAHQRSLHAGDFRGAPQLDQDAEALFQLDRLVGDLGVDRQCAGMELRAAEQLGGLRLQRRIGQRGAVHQLARGERLGQRVLGVEARVEAARREGLEKITAQVEPLKQLNDTLAREMENLKKVQEESTQLATWLEDQTFWADVLGELRRILIAAEEAQRVKLNSGPGTVGVWIDTLITTEPSQPAAQASSEETPSNSANPYGMDPVLMKRYGLVPRTQPAGEGAEGTADAGAAKKPKSSNSTNEIATVSLTLRAVNLSRIKTGANNELVFEVQNQMKASPFFDANETRFDGTLSEEENTFSFPMKIKLKRPMKL